MVLLAACRCVTVMTHNATAHVRIDSKSFPVCEFGLIDLGNAVFKHILNQSFKVSVGMTCSCLQVMDTLASLLLWMLISRCHRSCDVRQ